MKKRYLQQNVYRTLSGRPHFILHEPDIVYMSFSGGKDSGLLLNILLDFRDKLYPSISIGVFHQDFEAQHCATTEYVEEASRMLEKRPGAELYWLCLPMATGTALSSSEMYWYPWDNKKKTPWVRPMPEYDYVINLENNSAAIYHYRMHQEDLTKQPDRQYHSVYDNKRTVCLLGLCADEFMQCYSGFVNKKHSYKSKRWITRQFKEVWIDPPLYDWPAEDIWHAYYKFGYSHNSLYDLYYKTGSIISQMRVVSPLQDYAKESLNLYHIIDPQMRVKLLGHIQGANFAIIYAKIKIAGYRTIKLLEECTWKSCTILLLATLPKRLRQNYIEKFSKSITFRHTVGGGLEGETVEGLKEHDYHIKRNGVSNCTIFKNSRIIFLDRMSDDTDDVKSTKNIPSRKHMCFCTLRNDHICRSMGFGLTWGQQRRLDHSKERYKSTEVQMVSKSPVYHIRAVPIEKIIPNGYNPNAVASPEMKLSYDNTKADGYTVPTVYYYDEANDHYITADGFHRYHIMKEYPDIYEHEKGVSSVPVINKPLDQYMASVIRHNQARGSHDVDLTSDIVKELHELGRSDTWIAEHLSMDHDEILGLRQITGLAALFKEVNPSQSWEPIEDEEQLQSIEDQFVGV